MTRTRLRDQAAAIPFRRRRGRTEVALITSTDGKRWIVPKGEIELGESARESALREALEEAGLIGRLRGGSVGRIEYEKSQGTCRVEFFLMKVTEVLEHWSEKGLRRRRWVPLDEAQQRVDQRMRPILKDARSRIRR